MKLILELVRSFVALEGDRLWLKAKLMPFGIAMPRPDASEVKFKKFKGSEGASSSRGSDRERDRDRGRGRQTSKRVHSRGPEEKAATESETEREKTNMKDKGQRQHICEPPPHKKRRTGEPAKQAEPKQPAARPPFLKCTVCNEMKASQ